MAEGLWTLDDDAGQLDTASEAWSDVGTALGSAGDDVNAGAAHVYAAGWEGETATSFSAHRTEIVGDLDTASETAGRIASTLASAAGSVRVAQGQLDQQWATIVTIPHQGSPSGDIRWEPETEADSERITKAVQAAEQIRDQLDRTLRGDQRTLAAATRTWESISATWSTVAAGGDPFDLPEEGDDTGVITVGDETVVNTGGGDDEVTVWTDPITGAQIVIVNGVQYLIPRGQRITIRGGGGNDKITVPSGADVDLTLTGGEGDDVIHGGEGDDTVIGLDGDDELETDGGDDQVSGGEGRDYLDGQDGDDTVLGGEGDDTLYGLDGDDTLVGGEGQDYNEGGTGDDTVHGGEGNDILSGGDDDDVLDGGQGDDVSYAGRGNDTTYGGTGDDTAHSEAGDTDEGVEQRVTVEIPERPGYIRIEGSDDFVKRVEADLQMLMSSPRGQMMLENLQRNYDESALIPGTDIGKDGLTISEYPTSDNSTADETGSGSAEVAYSPRVDGIDGAPPVAVLYHELGHVYDYVNETLTDGQYNGDDTVDHGVNNRERVAAGLPIDHDDDPSTPEIIDPDHPFEYTENGLREELGVDDRESYS